METTSYKTTFSTNPHGLYRRIYTPTLSGELQREVLIAFDAKTLPVGDNRGLFLPLLKDFLYYGQRRERVRPARIESDVSHNFRGL